jgi:hypothetical protein
MECQRCQYENRPGVKYCLKCGTKLELQWPQCGKRLPSAAAFCDECGFSLPVASETTPINYSQPHSYIPKYLADKILSRRQYLVEQTLLRGLAPLWNFNRRICWLESYDGEGFI